MLFIILTSQCVIANIDDYLFITCPLKKSLIAVSCN